MKRLVITENEQNHIRKLYNINEIDAEKVVSGLFDYAQKIAKGEVTPQSDTTTPSTDTGSSNIETISSPTDKLLSPLKNTKFPTNNFGVNRPGIDKPGQTHPGIDLTAPAYSILYAPGDGKVTAAQIKNDTCGGKIRIQHTNGLTSSFCHLSALNVRVGDEVKQGDRIGQTGGTPGTLGAGYSTGPHLHWEIRKGGKLVDPLDYVEQKFYDKESNKITSV